MIKNYNDFFKEKNYCKKIVMKFQKIKLLLKNQNEIFQEKFTEKKYIMKFQRKKITDKRLYNTQKKFIKYKNK